MSPLLRPSKRREKTFCFPLGFANRQVKINIILAPNLHGFFFTTYTINELIKQTDERDGEKMKKLIRTCTPFFKFHLFASYTHALHKHRYLNTL